MKKRIDPQSGKMRLDDLMWRETGRAYRAILGLYQNRKKLETFPRTPKIDAKIEELRNLELKLKKAMANRDFKNRLFEGAVLRSMESAEKHGQEQQRKRGKRQTWKGLTREQLSSRDQNIIEHFRKTHLSKNNFSNKYAKKYARKPSTVRHILSRAVGI